MITDHHFRPVAMLTQYRWNADIIVHIARLHRRRALAGIIRTEAREKASSRLNPVRKEMLEIEAVLLEMIEKGREADASDRLIEKSSIQPFHEDHEHISLTSELNAGGRESLVHKRVLRIGKHRVVPKRLLCDAHRFVQRYL